MISKSATLAFHVLQRPFLANRCDQRSSLPLSPLSWQQHRRVSTVISLRNKNTVCNSSYSDRFGEESPYEKELSIVERRRDELESLLEAYNRESFLRSGYTKGSIIGYEEKWLDKLEIVINFYHKMGRLPKLTAEGEEHRLAIWMNNQRSAKRCLDEGKPCNNKMTPERIAILESMSWWIWDPYEAAWQEKFEELVDYVDRTGEIPPVSHPTLGYWVDNQRMAYKAWKARQNGETEKYKGVLNYMNEERAKKLESIWCWKWDMRD